jgi:ribosomal protein S2
LLKSVKALLPVFLNLSENKASNVLFVATKALYSKSVFLNEYKSLVKRVSNRKPGVFTNFSICGMSIFNKLDFKNIPSILVFFYFEEKDPIFLEAKKKCIPVVSFIDSKVNPVGVDYPVVVNTGYFYTAYFFSKFLFNLLRLKKN